jgi:retinol dehydrogenase 12
LDCRWNNAAVMSPPQGSVTKQGYEPMLGSNTLGPFLFTRLLTPLLASTAKCSPPGSVRVIWVSSSAAEILSSPGGVEIGNLDYKDMNTHHKYAVSKAGTVFLLHSKQYAKLHKEGGIVSVVSPLSIFEYLSSHYIVFKSREFEDRPSEECRIVDEQ